MNLHRSSVKRIAQMGAVFCASMLVAGMGSAADPQFGVQQERSWRDPAVVAASQKLGGETAVLGNTLSSIDALAAALTFSPQMSLARAQMDVARAGVAVARQRPNPTLSLSPERVLGAIAGGSPWVAAISLVWPVQTAGKRSLAIEQALTSSDATLLNAAGAVWSLRTSVRAAVCSAELASSRVALVREELAQREELVARLDKQAAAGTIARYDAARSRLERDGAIQRLHQAEADVRFFRQDIAAVTGLPLAEVDARALGDTCLAQRFSADSDAMREVAAKAVASRLDLRAKLAEFRVSDVAWRGEVAKRAPDLSLGPGYTYDQGDHKLTFTISGELPLYARNDAAIARAVAERNRVRAEAQALQETILYGVARAHDQMRAAEAQTTAAVDMVAQAQRLLDRDIARQSAGEIDQSAVVITRIAVSVARAEILTAQRGLVDAVASFEAAAQAPVVPPLFDGDAATDLIASPAESKEKTQ